MPFIASAIQQSLPLLYFPMLKLLGQKLLYAFAHREDQAQPGTLYQW